MRGDEEDLARRRAAMVEELVDYGITDRRVLAAMGDVPRHRFIPDDRQGDAYRDGPVPIGEGQTISQPYIVAVMTEALALTDESVVLEIGCGSGYGAAVLSRLARRVIAIERIEPLVVRARQALADLGYANVDVRLADGTLGAPADGPYDAISVTAGAPEVPEALVDQLRVGGRMVLPVGPHRHQDLVVITRTPDGVERTGIGPVAFVPLIGEQGWPDGR